MARCVEQFEARGEEVPVADIAAAFQEAVVDVITSKAVLACRENGITDVLLGGGVAANSRLRELTGQRCASAGIRLHVPPLDLCTDNGAMVAALGAQLVMAGVGAERHRLRAGLLHAGHRGVASRLRRRSNPANRRGALGGVVVVNHDGGGRVRVEVPRFGRATVRRRGPCASA